MRRNLLVFVTIFVLGTMLGTLGTISFPIGTNITYFWPAAALQTVCGIFFGFWGILGGVAFPVLSNALTDGSWAHTIGFIPANIIQCTLPRIIMSKFNISSNLMCIRDILLFIVGCAMMPHVLGSIVGCFTLYSLNNISCSSELWKMVTVWIIGNVPCAIVFGLLLLRTVLPVLKDCNLYYEGWLK